MTGEDVVSGDCPVALAFSVISFWLLDFSVNCIQGPVRTMVTDLLPNHQHEQGNSWFSFMASLGNFSANILGSISLVKYLPFFRTQTQALYVIGAILVSLSLIPALITVPNHPAGSRRLIRVDSLSKDPSAGIIATFMKSFREMPRAVRSVLWVQFCSWFAWFTTFMYFTPWLGEFVLQGDPHGNEVSKSTFDKGVRLGNLGLALQSGLAMVVSVQLATCGSCRCPSFVQFLIEKFGLKRVYLISQLIQSIALLCSIAAAMLHSPAIAISLIALTSFSWACTMTIPWAITGKAVSGSENKATILAIMNLSQSTPEIFSALVGFALVFFTGNSTSVLLAGSFAALCGAFFVISKRVGDHQ